MTNKNDQGNFKDLAPALAPEPWTAYTLPASPYPGCLTDDPEMGKNIRIDKSISICNKILREPQEHTCEGLPFCSVGRLGFVKSLWNVKNKLSNNVIRCLNSSGINEWKH